MRAPHSMYSICFLLLFNEKMNDYIWKKYLPNHKLLFLSSVLIVYWHQLFFSQNLPSTLNCVYCIECGCVAVVLPLRLLCNYIKAKKYENNEFDNENRIFLCLASMGDQRTRQWLDSALKKGKTKTKNNNGVIRVQYEFIRVKKYPSILRAFLSCKSRPPQTRYLMSIRVWR